MIQRSMKKFLYFGIELLHNISMRTLFTTSLISEMIRVRLFVFFLFLLQL
jgi:hypothetical protein